MISSIVWRNPIGMRPGGWVPLYPRGASFKAFGGEDSPLPMPQRRHSVKLARAFACTLLLAALAACGNTPTGPTPAPDSPRHNQGTQHGSGG